MPRRASQIAGELIDPTVRGVTSDYSIGASKTSGATEITATGAVALTVAQLLTKVIKIDPGGAGRALTFPTAAQLVAGGLGLDGDDAVAGPFTVVNTADGDEALTPGTSTGVTLNNNAAFSQNTTAFFYFRRESSTAVVLIQK